MASKKELRKEIDRLETETKDMRARLLAGGRRLRAEIKRLQLQLVDIKRKRKGKDETYKKGDVVLFKGDMYRVYCLNSGGTVDLVDVYFIDLFGARRDATYKENVPVSELQIPDEISRLEKTSAAKGYGLAAHSTGRLARPAGKPHNEPSADKQDKACGGIGLDKHLSAAKRYGLVAPVISPQTRKAIKKLQHDINAHRNVMNRNFRLLYGMSPKSDERGEPGAASDDELAKLAARGAAKADNAGQAPTLDDDLATRADDSAPLADQVAAKARIFRALYGMPAPVGYHINADAFDSPRKEPIDYLNKSLARRVRGHNNQATATGRIRRDRQDPATQSAPESADDSVFVSSADYAKLEQRVMELADDPAIGTLRKCESCDRYTPESEHVLDSDGSMALCNLCVAGDDAKADKLHTWDKLRHDSKFVGALRNAVEYAQANLADFRVPEEPGYTAHGVVRAAFSVHEQRVGESDKLTTFQLLKNKGLVVDTSLSYSITCTASDILDAIGQKITAALEQDTSPTIVEADYPALIRSRDSELVNKLYRATVYDLIYREPGVSTLDAAQLVRAAFRVDGRFVDLDSAFKKLKRNGFVLHENYRIDDAAVSVLDQIGRDIMVSQKESASYTKPTAPEDDQAGRAWKPELLVEALRDVVDQKFDLEERDVDIMWNGADITARSITSVALTVEESLTRERLQFAAENHDQDTMSAILYCAVALGIEKGFRIIAEDAEERLSEKFLKVRNYIDSSGVRDTKVKALSALDGIEEFLRAPGGIKL